MPGEMLGHREHRAAIFAENRTKLVVGDDLTLVLGILQIVLADMIPDLADHLAARQRIRTDDRGQSLRRGPRPLQAALPSLCHIFPPCEHLDRDRRKSEGFATALTLCRARFSPL